MEGGGSGLNAAWLLPTSELQEHFRQSVSAAPVQRDERLSSPCALQDPSDEGEGGLASPSAPPVPKTVLPPVTQLRLCLVTLPALWDSRCPMQDTMSSLLSLEQILQTLRFFQ